MAEKGVPIVTVKKIDNIPWGKGDLQSQRELLLKRGGVLGADFDVFEIKHIQTYIDKYCK